MNKWDLKDWWGKDYFERMINTKNQNKENEVNKSG